MYSNYKKNFKEFKLSHIEKVFRKLELDECLDYLKENIKLFQSFPFHDLTEKERGDIFCHYYRYIFFQ